MAVRTDVSRSPRRAPNFSSVFQSYPEDNLYHFGLSSVHDDLPKMFGDTEVVCMMGSADRAKAFAEKVGTSLFGMRPEDVLPLGKSDRGVVYKVGKVLSLSHGMGGPSCHIFLHETAKLLHHARVDFGRVRIIRLGTSGGLGVPGGTVVLGTEGVDAMLERGFEHIALGRKERFPAKADAALNAAIVDAWARYSKSEEAPAGSAAMLAQGMTMQADDYYEGQGRLDGAFPTWYDEKDKMAFLKQAHGMGVRNIEMEACVFLFFWQKLGVPATVICATLLDRLMGDQHSVPHDTIKDWSARPQDIVIEYLRTLYGSS